MTVVYKARIGNEIKIKGKQRIRHFHSVETAALWVKHESDAKMCQLGPVTDNFGGDGHEVVEVSGPIKKRFVRSLGDITQVRVY